MQATQPKRDQLHTIIAALPDLVFVLTESGQYGDIFGGEANDFYHDGSGLIGHNLFEMLPKEKAQWFLDKIKLTLDENKLMIFDYNLSADDVDNVDNHSGPAGELWFEGRVNPLPFLYNGERAVIWVARNVTQKRQLEMELRYLSETDSLTGLSNRRKLMQKLREQYDEFKRYQSPTSFILLDIDHFKSINDQFGHIAGDQAIRHVGTICASELRSVDLVGRLGGDEFGIVLPHTTPEHAMHSILRIKELIGNTPFVFEDQTIFINISIGLGIFDEYDESHEDIVGRADKAMYLEKNRLRGGNRTQIDPIASNSR